MKNKEIEIIRGKGKECLIEGKDLKQEGRIEEALE